MTKISTRICPICEAVNSEVLHQQSFVLPEGHPLSEGYDVVCCDRCGFVYADTTVSQEDYDTFYANFSKYEDNKTATGGGESPWDAERLQKTAACIADFLPDKNARILDIGCANGGLLGALKELGYKNLCGIDPSPACVDRTSKIYGIEAYACSLFNPPQNIGLFDCIILSHVLEHVRDIKPAMQCVDKLTKIDGCVYIEVPDAYRYADYVVAPFQEFNTEHINHFSHKIIYNLLCSLGFTLKFLGDKVLDTSHSMLYPAIYNFWTKERGLIIDSKNFSFERDNTLEWATRNYILRSKALMDKVEHRLQSVLEDSPEVIIWGTGQLSMKLLASTSLARAKIAACVDVNPINHGKLLCGVPVLDPEQIRGMKQPILVTSILHQEVIAEAIDKMQIPNKVILLSQE